LTGYITHDIIRVSTRRTEALSATALGTIQKEITLMDKDIIPLNDPHVLINANKLLEVWEEFCKACEELGITLDQGVARLQTYIAQREAERALSFSRMLPMPDTALYEITKGHAMFTFSDN
jgi:hypothetical protein